MPQYLHIHQIPTNILWYGSFHRNLKGNAFFSWLHEIEENLASDVTAFGKIMKCCKFYKNDIKFVFIHTSQTKSLKTCLKDRQWLLLNDDDHSYICYYYLYYYNRVSSGCTLKKFQDNWWDRLILTKTMIEIMFRKRILVLVSYSHIKLT